MLRIRNSTLKAFLFLLYIAMTPVASAQDVVWWEGEDAYETNFPKQTKVSESSFPEKAHLLSGGKWLTNDKPRTGDTAYAKYKVEVPADGKYRFYVRKYYTYGVFRWRFDDSSWRICNKSVPFEERVDLQDGICVNWFDLGWVELTKGRHNFEIRLLAKVGEDLHCAFDVFCLSGDEKLIPSGNKPPEVTIHKPGRSKWFPVVFYEDEFSKDSVIDISHLIETPAGKYGPLKHKDGRLYFEKLKKPVKFWGCNARYLPMGRAQLTQRIRYLRKHGINMVRQHPLQGYLGVLRKDGTFDPEKLDEWDWWFAELKKHGIYMTLSLFYPHHITRGDGYDLYDELPDGRGHRGGGGAKSTYGLVNIEPALQESEWRWAKKILRHKNKYTGIRYVDDPALAVVEVHNEDCIFWHDPLNFIADGKLPRHEARLKKRWAKWLKKRYGNDTKLRKAWGDGMRADDLVDNPNIGIYAAREMKADGPLHNKLEKKRMGDFIRFLSELQRGYYQKRIKQVRDLGFKGVTITTAWKAGGPAADPANLWCDTAGDMISRHNYFGGGAGRHNIILGRVHKASHLSKPGSGILAFGMYQTEGRAFCSTEWSSMPPNQWKFEIAPLVAFYGLGLQGWDASYHFCSVRNRTGNGWPGRHYYVTNTPHYIGQFPAIAFAIYNNHITEAPVVSARRVKEEDLFEGIDVLRQGFTIKGSYDKNVIEGKPRTPAELLAVGRVLAGFDGGKSEVKDFGRYWDKSKKIIRSMTGELVWDYGRELVTLSSPKTQAIIGRCGTKEIELPGVTARVKTPFVSMIFTPLDNVELINSKHILITALARDKQTGTKYNKDGTRLLEIGGPPLLMEPVQATIRFKGAGPKEINILDVYGVPTGQKVNIKADGSFGIDGTYTTYYYEVKR